MRLKKLGTALVVVAALGAVLASSAFAAATTTDVQWYTGASPGTVLSGSETIAATQVGTSTFTAHVSGTAYELKATGINCVNCKIENSGGTAIGSGELEFTGVTVVQPVGCTTPSTFKTKPLSVTADWMIGTVNYVKFVPTAGPTTAFATINITGPCATTLVPKGTVFVQSANATGTQAVEQQVSSSEAINTAAGGVAGTLHVGTEFAALTGTVKFKMSGAKAGVAFGTH
jgi:hypothetical protein